MSDNSDKAKKPAAKKRQAGRRPTTIELQATELDGETPAVSDPAKQTAHAAQPDAPTPSGEAAAAAGGGNAGSGSDGPPSGQDGKAARDDAGADADRDRRPPRAGAYAAVMAAALGGAVLALGGYVAAERAGLLRQAGVLGETPERLDALADDVAALRAARAEERARDDDGALAGRLDALETRLQELAEAGAAAAPAGIDNLEQRIAGAEAQLTLLRNEQTNLLERLQAAGGNDDLAGAIAALSQRVDGLETALEETGAAIAARTERIDALEQRLDTAQGRLDEVATQRPQTDARAALAIAIAGLERAVASGQPFARELDVVAELAGARSETEVLRPMAADGVARLDELTRSFEAAASRAVGAAEQDGSNDLVNRLLSSAREIVRVRPTGDVAGADTGAVLARAEARLREGDLLAATQQLSALDEAPQQAMAGWTSSARQRLTALRQVQSLSETAMEALRGAPAGSGR